MTKRAALDVRISTDRQTVENQIAALSKVAAARGWQIVETFSDAGISGVKGRKDRAGLDEMLKQAQRGKFDVVMAWAIETTTPSGKLMLQMTGAFAEFERAMIQARIHPGLRRAVADGRKLGRLLNDPGAIDKARLALGKGLGINRVAKCRDQRGKWSSPQMTATICNH
jgi:DNA invertase Pin-like site-specific DNA recombinase